MENADNILNELKEISPLLAGLSGDKNPFRSPETYFANLPDLILKRIRALSADSPIAEITALSEILNQIPRVQPFHLPTGYFENFPNQVIERMQSDRAASPEEELKILSPLLSGMDKKSPFEAPAGYFNELAGSLTAGIQAVEFVNDELENQSPLMARLKRKGTYEVPEGYFEHFPENMLNRVKGQHKGEGKLISFPGRKAWLRYAAAAAVTGILLTTGYFLFNGSNKVGVDPLNGLSKVSDQEIMNYLDNQDLPLADITSNSTAILDLNDNDIKDLLNEIPDGELQQYAAEHNIPKDLNSN